MLSNVRSAIIKPRRQRFLGQVATRCQVANNFLADTTGWNSQDVHYIRGGAVIGPSFVIGNWHASAGVGDVASGNIKTLKASIIYNSVATQLTVNGSSTIVIADGANVVTDPAPIWLPDGAQFHFKMFQTNTVGLQYYAGGTFPGDLVNNSGVDETMTTSTDAGLGVKIPPLAIVAMTRRPSIGLAGTSNAVGLAETDGSPYGDIGFMRLVGDMFPYTSMAISSDTTGTLLSSPKRLAILDTYVTHRWIEPGPGDPDLASVLADIAAFNARWPQANTILSDVGPTTTSTDNWATTASQIVTSQESYRLSLNSAFAAMTGFNQLVGINALTTQPGSPGIIKNDGSTAFLYTSDGGHWTTAMFQLMKANNPFCAAMVR